jgi:hypothetical protein
MNKPVIVLAVSLMLCAAYSNASGCIHLFTR